MRKKLMDTRVNLVMDNATVKALQAMKRQTGAALSELIRRAVREFMERRKTKA